MCVYVSVPPHPPPATSNHGARNPIDKETHWLRVVRAINFIFIHCHIILHTTYLRTSHPSSSRMVLPFILYLNCSVGPEHRTSVHGRVDILVRVAVSIPTNVCITNALLSYKISFVFLIASTPLPYLYFRGSTPDLGLRVKGATACHSRFPLHLVRTKDPVGCRRHGPPR